MICPVTLRSSLYQSHTTFEANCSSVLQKGHQNPYDHPCHHRIINPHIDLEMCDRRILWSQWCLPIDVQNFEMPSYEFNLTQECYASKRVHQFSLALYFHWCKSEWRNGVYLCTLCVPQVFLAISIRRSMLTIICPMMGWNGRNVGLKRLIVASFARCNLYVGKMRGLFYGKGVSNFM